MNSKLSRIQEIWQKERKKSSGCIEAIHQSLSKPNYGDYDKIRQFCPKYYLSSGAVITCHIDCLFSCVQEDAGLLEEVLRTLEEASEQIK